MKVVFVSNYINHHQIPFSDALYGQLGEDYHFIQTEPMAEERIQMGWALEEEKIPYVVYAYREEERCRQLIAQADMALVGWTLRTDLFLDRLDSGKLTLRISERLYREGRWKFFSPRGLLSKYREHVKYRKKPVYLLCAGGYVAADFAMLGAYPDKMFRFGYFPKTRRYEGEVLWEKKEEKKTLQLVWAGRMISLKHPEYIVRLAEELAGKGYRFRVHMVGGGRLLEPLQARVTAAGLADRFCFYGYLEPEKVREIMERGHIYLFTSNYLEGWGSVLNEAMNSGCAVVANAQAGATPFLVTDGVNGLVYQDGSFEAFAERVTFLFQHPERIEPLGREAYRTIAEIWNEERAAAECLRFYDNWKQERLAPPKEGPMSRAERLPARFSYREGKLE